MTRVEVTSLCTNTCRHRVFFATDQLFRLLHPAGSQPRCLSPSAAYLPRPVLACRRLVPASPQMQWSTGLMSALLGGHMSGAMNLGFSRWSSSAVWRRDEPVHCPADRCKLHQRCFGWLAITPPVKTPPVNEILIKFITTVHICRARQCFCYSECEHLEGQAYCKLPEYVLLISQGSVVTILRRGEQNYKML